MFKLPLYFSKKKLLLAFEYAMVISEVAQKQKVKLTPEIVERAEQMIVNEFRTKSPTKLAVEMIPNILSVFELDLSK